MINFEKKYIFISVPAIILVGVLGRFFMREFVGIPNFEIITALTLVSAVFLGRIWALVVPLSIVAITDVAIGNNSVLFFTWSAFAIIGVLGILYKNILKDSPFFKKDCPCRQVFGLTGMGIVSSVFFFIYTNFGWWLVSEMYPHTWDGLIQCYIMGLPFFKNNLIGNLIFVPMFSMLVIVIIKLKAKVENKMVNLRKVLSD